MSDFELKDEQITCTSRSGETSISNYRTVQYSGSACWDITDPSELDLEEALGFLLANEILLLGQRGNLIQPSVITSDVFAWGCADADEIALDDINNLFFLVLADRRYGSVRWACLKRNEKPQFPLEKQMRDAGAWDEVMESLPPNKYDEYRRNKVKEVAA